MKINETILIALAATLALAGCQQRREKGQAQLGAPAVAAKKETDPKRAQVLARVGATTITVGKFSDEINQQNPYIRMRFASLEQRKRFLQSMIRFEVLSQEAAKRRMDREPEVIRRVKRAMINQMMVKARADLVKMSDITPQEVEAFYQQNAKVFKQPAKVRVSQIVVATEAEARKVLAEAGKKPGDTTLFARLVQVHSIDQATKVRGGDLDYFAADGASPAKAVIQAAFGIKKMYGLAGPIKVDQGYAVLIKTGLREPRDRPLQLERGRIRTKLFRKRQKKALDQFVKGLHAKAKVEVLEQNLAKVVVKPGPVKLPPRGMAPHGHR